MKNYKKLKIWEKGMEISQLVYELSYQLPDKEKYGLVSQITRAAVSIPSNIAEGSSRSSTKEYIRFLEFSLGSAFELETQIILIKNLKITDIEIIDQILSLTEELQKMIHSFISKLKAS